MKVILAAILVVAASAAGGVAMAGPGPEPSPACENEIPGVFYFPCVAVNVAGVAWWCLPQRNGVLLPASARNGDERLQEAPRPCFGRGVFSLLSRVARAADAAHNRDGYCRGGAGRSAALAPSVRAARATQLRSDALEYSPHSVMTKRTRDYCFLPP